MSLLLWTNNASSLLASGINNSVTAITVTTGEGALFPSPGAGQVALITLESVLGAIEVVTCTGRTGDTLTVIRGAEGTTPIAFNAGSRVEIRATAGMFGALLQKGGGDTLTGTTNLTGVLNLGGAGSIQGGEFTGALRSAPGVTTGQITVSAGVGKVGADTILTSANLAASIPSGYALAVTGMIVLWSGTSLNVPTGWRICDGTGGTPDLRDNFVLGAGGALPTAGGSVNTGVGGAVGAGATGAYSLTVADLPAHSHRYWGPATAATFGGGGAGRTIDWGVAGSFQTNLPSLATNAGQQFLENTGSGTAHSHTIGAVTGHQHTCLPPYKALFYIMKT